MARTLRWADDGGVYVDGALVASLGDQPLLLRLFSTIVTRGGALDRSGLFEAVWIGQKYRPPSSDNALRVAMSRLRKRLEPFIRFGATRRGGRFVEGEFSVEDLLAPRLHGRDAVVHELAERPRAGAIVRVTGLPGAGVTAVCEAALARLRGGVGSVSLARVRDGDAARVAIAAAMAIPGLAALLVDAVDDVPDVVALVEAVRGAAPIGVCLTSRRSGGPGARIRVGPLDADASKALLVERSRSLGCGELANDPGLPALLASLGGHVGSIALAASWVAPLGAVATAALFAAGAPPVDDGVRELLHELPDDLLAAGRRLAHLSDGFDLELAASVMGLDLPTAAARLTALEATSLVCPPVDGRFRVPVRAAAVFVAGASEADRDAVAAAFTELAGSRTSGARSGVDGWLLRERGNVLALLASPIGPDPRAKLALVATTLSVVHPAGVPGLVGVLSRALAGSPAAHRGDLLAARAQSRRLAGDPLGALDDLDVAELEAPDAASRARLLRMRSLVLVDLRRTDDAEASLRALLLLEGLSPADRWRAEEALATVECEAGRLEASRARYLRARVWFEEASDAVSVHRTLLNLAEIERKIGDLASAEARLDAADQVGPPDVLSRAHAVANRGWIARVRGDEPEARRLLERAAELAEGSGMFAYAQAYRDVTHR